MTATGGDAADAECAIGRALATRRGNVVARRPTTKGRAVLVSIRRSTAILIAATMLVVAACSDDDGGGDADDADRSGEAGTSALDVGPLEPAADLSEELTGGAGVLLAAATSIDIDEAGWVESEHVAAGTATSYRAEGDLPGDGRFELVEDLTADYRTRILVRRPADAADFNGTLVVEWLNVSGGFDANPGFTYMADELVRGGYAWVGVSAQHGGIEGGPVAVSVDGAEGIAGKGLKSLDPERYDSLSHPGDAFSYDIYTQVARALRVEGGWAADGGGEPGDAAPVTDGVLGDLEVERLLAVGQSQSAFALTTYVNGVQPLARQFDGFLLHSRGGGALPLGEPDEGMDIASAIGGPPVTIRTDQDAPVLVLQSESDVVSVIGSHAARQPDTEHFRLWEVAGTAHADRYQIGPLADMVDCGAPVNDGPQHLVVKAALRHLDTWARTGEAPPEAPRLEIDDTPEMQRDEDGIALGGIRTPQVDVPVATLSGEPGPEGSVICGLLGSTVPLGDERLAELHGSPDDYLTAYEGAADATIDAGFVLAEDRGALLAAADPSSIPE
jgi:hypothetical protein